ncbi:MAG: DUF4113 domain-containing protein [bacterium]|nr:DUF4113 domain-containing protein [bacterium]
MFFKCVFEWRTTFNYKSPAYTTDWGQLPVVK